MKKTKKLLDEYRFPGFRPLAVVKGKFGDPKARIITLVRSQKKLFAAVVVLFIGVFTTTGSGVSGIYLAAMPASIWMSKCGGSIA